MYVLSTPSHPTSHRQSSHTYRLRQTNWEAAHVTFDPEGKSKLASFKTVTQKASKKAGGGGAAAKNGEVKPKKAPAKRKKSASEANEDSGDGASKPKKARAPAKKGKKAASEENLVDGKICSLFHYTQMFYITDTLSR